MKMGLLWLVLQLLILLNVTVHKIVAQPEGSDCAYVLNLLRNEQAADRFFQVLRGFESGGNVCKINGTRIGPYQISREYYDVAVGFNEDLDIDNTWNHVWGNLSDAFSRRVIRNYLCKIEIDLKARNSKLQVLIITSIAAIHKYGKNFKQREPAIFGGMVTRRILNMIDPLPILSESCDPPCRAGQCCRNNICYCLDSATLEEYECGEQCQSGGASGLDLVFVLDGSGSIGSDNFEVIRQSLIRIVNGLTIEARVAVMVFSNNATIVFNLNRYSDKDSLIQGIRNIPYNDGSTYTDEALALLRTSAVGELLGLGSIFETIPIAIVMTDGRSTNAEGTILQAGMLHDQTDFQIFAVGIGDNINTNELMVIASQPSNVILIEDFSASEFQRFEDEIVQQTCTAPRSLSEETMVDNTLGQGAVARYRVRIPEEGITLMFDIDSGKVLLCGSRIQTPDCRDESTYEWRCAADSYCDVFVKGSSRKRRQAGTEFMFVSIEGIENNNELTVQTMTGDETISNAVSPIAVTDTVINLSDPLYEVPVTHTPPGMDTTTTSLCFQVHGESRNYYNLISDDCIQVNVLYEAFRNFRNENFIKEIGILAHDLGDNCTEIRLRANRCSPIIDGIPFNESYDENGITVINSGKRSFEITVPNCKATEADDIKFEIACRKTKGQKVIQFNVVRGGGIKPGAHGIMGQFWNVPVNVLNYTGNYSGSTNNTYTVTVDHPDVTSPLRTFIAELHSATWDGKRKQCLYVGSAQSGAINEVDVPNDHVIEGTYDNYEVSGLFDSDFQYNKFQDDRCA